MPRKRQNNTVRTDLLERMISHYHALRNYDAEEAIRRLARSVGAPIDEDIIAADAQNRHEIYFPQDAL